MQDTEGDGARECPLPLCGDGENIAESLTVAEGGFGMAALNREGLASIGVGVSSGGSGSNFRHRLEPATVPDVRPQ